ncbi:MAG: PASTA domain-containing protein [Actinobacteria bacterium]|nr:MAG: PASTA domain-containing protein [Actinomycetota bacterium]
MSPEDRLNETAATTDENEDSERRRGWVPWVVLLAVLALVAWLIWTYSDLGKAPDQADKGGVVAEQTAVVPDVVGMSRARAVRTLEAAGFSADTETSYDALAEPGTVAAQDPPAGQRVLKGMSVLVSVASRIGTGGGAATGEFDSRVQVPDVIGLTEQQANQTLSSNGYPMNVNKVYSASEPQGVVFEQNPGPNEPADPGTAVDITISLGSAPASNVKVPDVVGMSQEDAEAAVRAAGLEPRPNYQPRTSGIGKVYQQSPEAGELAQEGRFVFLLVAVRP